MVNPKLSSHKLVIPAMLYHKRTRIPAEWTSVIGDANYSILVSGRTGCLSKETEVMIPGQGSVKICDCPKTFTVYSYNFGKDQIESKPAVLVNSGIKKVRWLRLSNCKEVRCTDDHKFFVKTKNGYTEKKMLDLRVGDELFQMESTPDPGKACVAEIGSDSEKIQTFDLKVADNHNFFLANGVLTHNSGKDSLTTFVMNLDLAHDRTVIVLDTKMEYPCAVFCQLDVVLRNILLKNGLVGRGYKTVLWIPFVEGLDKNQHFREILSYHHPNLEIRPFRIRIADFTSDDSYNMSLQKTQLQANSRKDLLSGTSKITNDAKEYMGQRMGFDDDELWEPGCGWEYLNFEELTTNKKVNVIATFFMSKNSITATSYMIGLLNDFLTIGKSINRVRRPDELFTIIIPEVEIILPKGVKSLDQVVNTLRFSMRMGLKLMRSFGVRFRMNLQNLSSLDPDMVSQSVPFAGRTWNPKDLNMLGIFGLSKKDRLLISRSRIGQFRDVIHGKEFSAVPFSHKAREMEYFVSMMRSYYKDPSLFLFETENYFLSEMVDYEQFFYDGKPLSVQEYNRRVRAWLDDKEPRPVLPLAQVERSDDDLSDEVKEKIEALLVKRMAKVINKEVGSAFNKDLRAVMQEELGNLQAEIAD
jgi:hypothetical protein